MNKTIALSIGLLFTAQMLFGQVYVRPVTLPEGTGSKIINVVVFQDGTRIVVDKDRDDKNAVTPGGEAKDTLRFLLIDGMWLETTKRNEGNMKLDQEILPLDGVKFKGVAVSDANNRKELAGHESLQPSVTVKRTAFKYKDTLNLDPALKDSVLRFEDHLVIRCGEENGPSFRVILNDTALLPNAFPAGTDIDFDLSTETLKKQGIPDGRSIKKVTVIPEGHIPAFISDVKFSQVDDRSTLPPVEESKIPWWIWVVGGVVIALTAAALIWKPWKKKRVEEAKEDNYFVPPVIKETDKEKERLKYEKDRLEDELRRMKNDLAQRVEDARDEARRKSEKEIDRLKDEKQGLEEKIKGLQDRVKEEKEDADRRVSAVREEERSRHENTINTLTEEKKELQDELIKEKELAKEQVAAAHEEEKQIAEKTISDLKAAHKTEVERLENEQRIYSEKIAFVPFAAQYAKDIYSLIGTVNDINKQAKELTKADVEDPYLIFKAISKFNLAQAEIDYENLLLDVSLAANDEMSFADSGITNLKTVPQDQMFSSLRSYFLSAYLEKYINAAVVYNESLAGIDRLVEGIDASMTAPFKVYRENLKECCERLGIAVISVKLFDTLGDNMDLKATMVDYDESLPADSIIAIENCLVYPEGGRRPTEKIYVKAQK